MPIRVKDGGVGAGVWRVITDGKFHVKDGGVGAGVWRPASQVLIKTGAVGGGMWRDSDYRGFPNPPRNINVGSWDNTNFEWINIDWTAPVAGGAPIDHYEVEMRWATGSLRSTKYPPHPPTSNFDVEQDQKIQFRARSISTGGLPSEWTPYLQVLMGHKEDGHFRTENRTRDWYEQVTGPWYQDAYAGGETVVRVPSGVTIKRLHYDLYAQGNFTSVLSPYGSREVRLVVYSVDYTLLNMGNPYERIVGGYDHDGDNQHLWWGPRCRGSGWSDTASGSIKMLGKFGVEGVETYQVQVYVVDRAHKANSYW